MLFVTHLAFGILMFLIANAAGITSSYLALAVCLFGSMLPDIDRSRSKIGKKFWLVSWLAEKIFHHRGPIHSILFMLFFSAVFGLLFKYLGLSQMLTFWLAIGYLSHLVLDSLTPQGVAWLFPLKYRIRFGAKTGSLLEKVILALIVAGIVYLLVKHNL